MSMALAHAGIGGSSSLAAFVEETDVLHTIIRPGTFGWAVSELVDIDGDGAMDLIMGANAVGKTYVFSGRSGSLIHEFSGLAGDMHGYAVADAGDEDRDGVHDVVAGAPNVGPGRAYVYSGATGELIGTLVGETAGEFFGSSVGGAGDVNQDGYADLLVGAELSDQGGDESGRAYIFSGLDGTLIRHLEAERFGDNYGSGAAGTGDLNGDGIGDQIIGARDAGPGRRGRAYVYSGATGELLFPPLNADITGAQLGYFFVGGVGDVDNDGNRDVYAGDFAGEGGRGRGYVFSGIDGALIWQFRGEPGDGFGPGRGAGDVDNDGHHDVIVGAWTHGSGCANAGRTIVFSGRTGEILRTTTSTTCGENFGFDTVGVGDVNEDGMFDFLCSAATQNRVYVIAGNIEPHKKGDINLDGSVNLADYALFAECVTGSGNGMLPGCGAADVDDDFDVDVEDFAEFQRSFEAP
jgi:hypothetical protein